MARKPAIIVDLDGTLTNYGHRAHLLPDWPAFFQHMGFDPIIPWCETMVRQFHAAGYTIIILTGRPSSYRKVTEQWLRRYKIPYDLLLMRDADDWRPGAKVKADLYQCCIAPHYDVLLALDDNPYIARMWRTLGVQCLYCGTMQHVTGEAPTP